MNFTESQADEEYVLFGKIDNVKNLVTLLKAVHIKDNATVLATDKGLKVVVEDSKCAQAIAFVESAVFHEYQIKEDVSFVINLAVLLECLNIFGTGSVPGVTTALQMGYLGHGSPLSIMLEEGGVITDCQLKTQDPEEILDFEFCTSNIMNKVILKPDVIKDVWSELDMGSDILEITFSPENPHLKFSTVSSLGKVQVEFSKDSDLVEFFQCTEAQRNQYKMNLMKTTSKALAVCIKLCVRTDNRGFLNIQYMVNTEGGQTCFVDFYVSPNEDYDSD